MSRSCLLVVVLVGCSKAPPPPAPPPVTAERFYSRVGKSSLNLLKWPDGATVLVWTDIDGRATSGIGPCPTGVAYSCSHWEVVTRRQNAPEPPPGAPKPPGPGPAPKVWDEETGRNIHWRCETADGRAGGLSINGNQFDLAKGNVFLVSTGDTPGVTQLTRDYSGLALTHESLAALAKDDEVIRKFVENAAPSK